MRFHHRAVPIVLAAVLVDTIGFGIVLPVLPSLVVHLGHVTLAEATRIAGYLLVVYAVAQFFAGPVLVAGFFDLREKGMLGDTGSNVVGALAGLWMVLTLDTDGQVIALVVLLVVNVIGEFTSISAFIEKVPGLRHLDSLGRPS